jgi:hypothetical protein
MKRKGVSYDVGRVMFGNWRPDYDPKVVHRELEIIKNDLHCNAVRICGLDIDRLRTTAEDALENGLEVWLSPELWDKSPEKTLDYVAKAATDAEKLREKWPEQLVFSIGSELTLFMQGIVQGRSFMSRLRNPSLWETIKAGKHNKPLNVFLAKANEAVRQVFHGKVTYVSLPWEAVNWNLFDVVGVDHYWDERIQDRYAEMLKPFLAHGKPVFIGEFGFCTYQGAEKASGRAWNIVDYKSMILHSIPVLGHFVRPQLNGEYVRDEGLQARELAKQLSVLDAAGVDGAFVFTFVAPRNPYDEDPKYDLDMASYSLVKSYTNRHGATYPDMTWEPKESFHAVADYYAKH